MLIFFEIWECCWCSFFFGHVKLQMIIVTKDNKQCKKKEKEKKNWIATCWYLILITFNFYFYFFLKVVKKAVLRNKIKQIKKKKVHLLWEVEKKNRRKKDAQRKGRTIFNLTGRRPPQTLPTWRKVHPHHCRHYLLFLGKASQEF